MAGDWIPFDHDLPDKEEVIAIATRTGAGVAETVLRLCRLWCWFDRHTIDGKMKRIGNAGVTLQCGGDEAFWDAVCEVGWLKIDGDGVSIPDFEKRFGASARRRLLAAKRIAAFRARQKCNALGVTDALPNAHPQPQPQEVSKDTSKESTPQKQKRFMPPTVEEVRTYCEERRNGIDAQAFVDHYTANGWKRGKTPMKDWQAAVRTWENQRKQDGTKPTRGRYRSGDQPPVESIKV
jgi:hypothetical protein